MVEYGLKNAPQLVCYPADQPSSHDHPGQLDHPKSCVGRSSQAAAHASVGRPKGKKSSAPGTYLSKLCAIIIKLLE